MNNTVGINSFNSININSNIDHIKAQHPQMMTTMTNEILKFEPVIKKAMTGSHILFAVVDFNRINSFA